MKHSITNIPLIEVKSISKAFDYQLFENLNLKLCSKQSVSIVGRSGSGKSTLLHTIATLQKPDSGKVELFGEDIYTLPKNKIESIRRERLGIIFQQHYLFKGMTALENIEAATLLANTDINKDIFKMLEIDDIINKRVGDLSGGQQQRVSIARVLSKMPRVILADEPTGNLDRDNANLAMDALNSYIKEHNATLFVVTHDNEIAKKTQKCYELKNKRLIAR